MCYQKLTETIGSAIVVFVCLTSLALAGPALSINAAAPRHAISNDIYGMNFADQTLAAELQLPVRRWGGNSTTRYNWQNSMTNNASDWYFENTPDGSVVVANLPNGSASDQFVEQDRSTGTKSLITIPMIGWTVKTGSPRSHPYNCGFKISKYGAQQDADWQWDADCGNGVSSSGATIAGNDPADTSMAIDTTFVTGWVNHLKARYGTAANGGVAFYNLDNEPMLWNSTHRDVHPSPTSYDELRDKTYLYAAAIKAADPGAKTLGPVLWGWTAYFYSALDAAPGDAWWNNPLDRLAHNNMEFVAWYLQQMRTYEQNNNVRILDYLDLHNYPQGAGVFSTNVGDTNTQALRLRSTRSLWDAAYTDESWISTPVNLIPRMKAWVNTYYPGTKLAITEYNWGALNHINGALAQADVLGIFGREGLDLATLWDPPTTTQAGAFAFRMFRNYDGAKHGFGESSVQASSADQATLSVYAAQRAADRALTIMVINKTATTQTSSVAMSGFTPAATAAVYRYAESDLSAITKLADQAVTASGFSATFAPNSITLFVLSSGTQPPVVAPPAAPAGLTVN